MSVTPIVRHGLPRLAWRLINASPEEQRAHDASLQQGHQRKMPAMTTPYVDHLCDKANGATFTKRGVAIDQIWFDHQELRSWVAGNGEYATAIQFCPFCGLKLEPPTDRTAHAPLTETTDAELMSALAKAGAGLHGVSLEFRRSGTGWPGPWRARLVATKNERADYRFEQFGETWQEAVTALLRARDAAAAEEQP